MLIKGEPRQWKSLVWYKIYKMSRSTSQWVYVLLQMMLFIYCFFFYMEIYGTKHHDDDIEWKHFPRYWPFVRGIHRSPVNSSHKGQWSGALMFSLICASINDWVSNGEAGDFRRHRAHYDVNVMTLLTCRPSLLRSRRSIPMPSDGCPAS